MLMSGLLMVMLRVGVVCVVHGDRACQLLVYSHMKYCSSSSTYLHAIYMKLVQRPTASS